MGAPGGRDPRAPADCPRLPAPSSTRDLLTHTKEGSSRRTPISTELGSTHRGVLAISAQRGRRVSIPQAAHPVRWTFQTNNDSFLLHRKYCTDMLRPKKFFRSRSSEFRVLTGQPVGDSVGQLRRFDSHTRPRHLLLGRRQTPRP